MTARMSAAILLAAMLLLAAPASAQAQAQADGLVCVRDRAEDQRAPLNPDRPDIESALDGSSDLVEVCLSPSGGLTVTTAAATGIGDDPRWIDGASAITVGIDEGGRGTMDVAVQVEVNSAGGVVASVLTSTGDLDGSCPVDVEETVVTVAGDCLQPLLQQGADTGVHASLRLDADPLDEYAPVIIDVAPDGGGFVTEDGSVTGAPVGSSRLAGPTRIETAVAIATAQFPGGAPTVYLARADDLTDAVAGGSLRDGPVLLVPSCDGVPEVVADEIDRVDPVEVIALGGTDAVCDVTVEDAAAGRSAGRLAGTDRFATGAEIAARAYPGGADDVFLARVDDVADAIAAGSLDTGPVLLVPGCGDLPDGVRDAIRRILPNRVIALGGEDAVCEEVLQAAVTGDPGQRDLTPLRLGGADRFETAALIAERRAPGGAPVVFLARADDPADAVAGGVLTAGPTLLVPRCDDLPAATIAGLEQVRPDRIVTLGGDDAVCAATLQSVVEAAGL